ncbi:MAG TPA: hypothetical protein QGF58_26940 [Myxococcota bacterium]|nr:hypothetical protein [Myxococcota bacterium]
MIWLALGCLRAVQHIPESHPETWTGRLEVAVPAGWELVRNVRGPLGQHLALHGPDGSSITIDLLREDARSRELPLSVVVDTYAVELGRGRGIESDHHAQHQLEVAERSAWATTVERRVGPHTRTASTVGLRGEKVVVFLTLHANSEDSSLAWEQVLTSFDLPLDAPPETPPFAEDLAAERRLDSGKLD